MGYNTHKKRKKQLGMHPATAQHKLRKAIMFMLVQETHRDECHQCGKRIMSIEELSIEHKVPYLDGDNPRELFFDLTNIAFSHFACNVRAGRKPHQKYFTPEERRGATNRRTCLSKRREYTIEKRRERYKRTGH